MSKAMEGANLEKPKISDPGLEAEMRKREIMGLFEILEDIIQRADTAEDELKKSLDLLRSFQEHKYGEVLKLLQEENSEGALVLLKESDEKATRAKLTAGQIESLMDDLVRKTGELRGIIQPENRKNIS